MMSYEATQRRRKMAESTVVNPANAVKAENITSQIALSCSFGRLENQSVHKIGSLIMLSVLFTATQNLNANTDYTLTATHASDRTKPVLRSQVGGANHSLIRNFVSSNSSGNFSFAASGAISSGTAFWLNYIYMCSS